DSQPHMDTNETSNKIDTGDDLSSSVSALAAFQGSTTFGVSWSGHDSSDGSGISSFTIYVSDNNGPFKVWLPNTTLTSAQFVGQAGPTYGFSSVATNGAGNVEAALGPAQATTTIDLTPPAASVVSFPAGGGSYNTAHWSGSISGSAGDGASGV